MKTENTCWADAVQHFRVCCQAKPHLSHGTEAHRVQHWATCCPSSSSIFLNSKLSRTLVWQVYRKGLCPPGAKKVKKAKKAVVHIWSSSPNAAWQQGAKMVDVKQSFLSETKEHFLQKSDWNGSYHSCPGLLKSSWVVSALLWGVHREGTGMNSGCTIISAHSVRLPLKKTTK